jgi:hypothetical protein
MKTNNKISLIINESYIWRNRSLLESDKFVNPSLTLRALISKNLAIFIVGLMLSIFFSDLVNPIFAGYTVTALSIFVGLFTTILILIFDKFINNSIVTQKKEKDIYINNKKSLSDSQLSFIRTKNFSRKFVFVSLEGLLIAIAVIIFFLVPLMLKDRFTIDLLNYTFVFNNITINAIGIFFINTLILVIRVFIIIFLYKFFKYLIVIFSLLVSYIKGVFDNNVNI